MLERFRRPRVILPTLAVLVLAAFVLLTGETDEPTTAGAISARVRSGEFRVVVSTTGELRARDAVQIQGPPNMQQAGSFQTRIASLVPEGTVVSHDRARSAFCGAPTHA
jgi:hypothetical protein